MAGENTAVRFLQGGSVLEVGNGGTLSVLAGGSIQNAGGMSFSGTVSIGGVPGRWAFGSAALASGTVMVFTGLSQVVSFAITPVGSGTGAGTATSFQLDLSRAANGSVFAFGLSGTAAFAGAGTVLWNAMGY